MAFWKPRTICPWKGYILHLVCDMNVLQNKIMCKCPGTHAYYKYGYPLTTTEYLLHLFQDINLPQIRSYGCVLKHIIIPYSCICPFCIKKRFFQKIKIQACLSERQGRCHDQSKPQLPLSLDWDEPFFEMA